MSSRDAAENVGEVIEQLLRAGDGAAVSRRDALRLLGMAGLSSIAGGCASAAYPTALGSARPVGFSGMNGARVAIDVHTHIFNVRDVPAAEYALNSLAHLGEVHSGQNLAPRYVGFIRELIVHLTRGLAQAVPCARQEREMLLALESAGSNPLLPQHWPSVGDNAADQCAWRLRIRQVINNLREEEVLHLMARAEGIQATGPEEHVAPVPCAAYTPIAPVPDHRLCQPATPETYARFAGPLARFLVRIERLLFGEDSWFTRIAWVAGKSEMGPTVNEWLRRMTRPRYEIARELIQTYGASREGEGGDAVDAFVVAMVDMEHWLDSSADDLEEQMLLTREIARLSGGRLLPFIAYDPLRDVRKRDSGFKLVQRAIESHGFVGVKLYPANGFRPFGNAALAEDFPSVAKGLGSELLGQQLDARLHALYRWCEDRGVPIMAHGNDTSGTFRRFADRGNPIFWSRVAERYPRLRINIGHFGGMDSLAGARRIVRRRLGVIPVMTLEDAPENWSIQILQMMTAHPNVFSDTGAFGGVLEDTGELSRFRRNLGDLLGEDFYPAGSRQLMYASDWYMVAATPGYREYHERFSQLFRTRLYGAAAPQLLGNNAVRFLGLRRGDATRERLDRFYAQNGVAAPAWQVKVDAMRQA